MFAAMGFGAVAWGGCSLWVCGLWGRYVSLLCNTLLCTCHVCPGIFCLVAGTSCPQCEVTDAQLNSAMQFPPAAGWGQPKTSRACAQQ